MNFGARAAQEPISIEISADRGIGECRFQARRIGVAMGFNDVDLVAITTCVSELARNIEAYAGQGTIRLEASTKDGQPCLRIGASDAGPGIPHLDEVLSGKYRSRTGMGKGILSVKRLSDECAVSAKPGEGTRVELIKYLRKI